MAFRKISYLIPSCDGCGLAWSFYDPACAEGIPPHFASRAAALAQLEQDYGWLIVPLPVARPLMACRRCAAAGVIPATLDRRWLLAVAGWVRRFVPFGAVLRRMPAEIGAGIRSRWTRCCRRSRRGCWLRSTPSSSRTSEREGGRDGRRLG